MYTINRNFGISSTATGYEYHRFSRGEFGETQNKVIVIPSAASMGRIYKLTNGYMSSSRTKQVKLGKTYRKILKVS